MRSWNACRSTAFALRLFATASHQVASMPKYRGVAPAPQPRLAQLRRNVGPFAADGSLADDGNAGVGGQQCWFGRAVIVINGVTQHMRPRNRELARRIPRGALPRATLRIQDRVNRRCMSSQRDIGKSGLDNQGASAAHDPPEMLGRQLCMHPTQGMDLLVPTHQDLVGAAARTAVLAFEDGAGGDDGARRTVGGGIELIHGAGAARHAGADMPEADGSCLGARTHSGACASRLRYQATDPSGVGFPGNELSSHQVAPAVLSPLTNLTTVFGMGTGVASSLESPGNPTPEGLAKLHCCRSNEIISPRPLVRLCSTVLTAYTCRLSTSSSRWGLTWLIQWEASS